MPSATSVPPHLRRPPFSQATSHSSVHSISSVTSHPHAQQHTYVPIFEGETNGDGGLNERALFENQEISNSHQVEGEGEREGEEEWTQLYPRDGSIANRPKWRRPRLAWVYPFILGASLSLGMGMAPKSELMINLACLAHPPSSSSYHSNSELHLLRPEQSYHDHNLNAIFTGIGIDQKNEADSSIELPMIPINNTLPLSPADKWFLKMQHDMYDYRLAHTKIKNPTPSPSSPPDGGNDPRPTEPLPRPKQPKPSPSPESGTDDDDDDNSGSDNDEHDPFHAIDPRTCKKDPKVQAAAARLIMIMTLSMGLLSAITTGYWGQKSDKLGRTKIMAIVEFSMLINEICFIFVATFPYLAPGGYRSLLIGPILEGLLGGLSTLSATINAYVSDVTPEGSRTTAYARLTGFMMGGFASGPILGSLLITATGNIMAPFYVNVVVHSIYIPLILFVLPESLSSDARVILAKNRAAVKEVKKRRDAAEREWESETPAVHPNSNLHAGNTETAPLLHTVTRRLSMRNLANAHSRSKRSKRFMGNLIRFARKLRKPIDPLAIFLPRDKEDGSNGKDWNLTAVGFGIFFLSMVMGVLQTKAQYTFYAFGWTSAQLGPYMSIVSFSRSFVLIVLVPIIMYFVKPHFIEQPTTTPSESGVAGESAFTSSSMNSEPENNRSQQQVVTRKPTSSSLDLLTVRICIMIEIIPYILLTLGTTPSGFIFYSALLTFGSPSSPASNSLALSLLKDSSESGRLFGGLAVVHATGASLISPLVFGNVFAATVGWYAPTIFALAAGSLILAQIAFAFVRLDKKKDENTVREEEGRGRSRKVKRVPSASGSGFTRTPNGNGKGNGNGNGGH